MGIMTQIQHIFAGGPDRRFTHPDFGELVYDGIAWRTPGGSDLYISFYSSRHGPDEHLVKLASLVWSRLAEFEDSARRFVEASAPNYVSSLGKLGGVDFLFPDKAWLRQERAVVQHLSTSDQIGRAHV